MTIRQDADASVQDAARDLPPMRLLRYRCSWSKRGTEAFDKTKLINGIVSAIKKRPVSAEKVTEIANYVENYYANALRTVARSAEIGELVLEKLRDIDPISYIRFASVYKDFTDIDSFVAAISEFDRKEQNSEENSENKNTEV